MYNYPGQQQLPYQQQQPQQQTGYYGQQQPQQLQSQPTGYIQQYQTGIAPQQTGYVGAQYGQQQPQQFLQTQPTGYMNAPSYAIQQNIPSVPTLPQQYTTTFQQPSAPATTSAPTNGGQVKIPNGMLFFFLQ